MLEQAPYSHINCEQLIGADWQQHAVPQFMCVGDHVRHKAIEDIPMTLIGGNGAMPYRNHDSGSIASRSMAGDAVDSFDGGTNVSGKRQRDYDALQTVRKKASACC